MSKRLTIAVDFDGCLCKSDFPDIGEQTDAQKELLVLLKNIQSDGNKLILWTSRGEPHLSEAINWCKDRGLEFDAINKNPWIKKVSGYSPKIVADYYIDDKALTFSDKIFKKSLEIIRNIANGS